MAPVFDGSVRRLEEFLEGVGVRRDELFELPDRAAAFSVWARHISAKRAGKTHRRPVADVLIGALAMRGDGIITRNGSDFVSLYPDIRIIDPTKPTRTKGAKRLKISRAGD